MNLTNAKLPLCSREMWNRNLPRWNSQREHFLMVLNFLFQKCLHLRFDYPPFLHNHIIKFLSETNAVSDDFHYLFLNCVGVVSRAILSLVKKQKTRFVVLFHGFYFDEANLEMVEDRTIKKDEAPQKGSLSSTLANRTSSPILRLKSLVSFKSEQIRWSVKPEKFN